MNEFLDIAKVANSVPSRTAAISPQRLRRALLQAFSAFTTGARLIPMGDNGQLLKSLAAKSADR